MGKVQDTFSRIARRTRHKDTPAIALIVPSQQQATNNSFPTTCAAVANWLNAQSNAAEDARIAGLTRAIKHSNRLQNTAAERLKICNLFSLQIKTIMPVLTRQFKGADLPYQNDSRNAFDTATTLLQELSYGYKIALVDVLMRRSNLNRMDRIHCIYYAMKNLGECGLRHSQSYIPWPEKYWRDINTLYWLAENEKAIDVTISTAIDKADIFPASVGKLYATLATFNLSNNDHLQAPAMDQLINLLSNHSEHLCFSKSITNRASASLYSVAINSPNPPAADRFCVYAAEDQVRYLDLQMLCEALQHVEPNSEQTSLSRQQLQKITHIWSHATARTVARSICSQTAATVSGLKEVHALYSQQHVLPAHVAGMESWTVINHSANGIGLKSNTRNDHQLQIGELIGCAISDSDSRSLHTGVIRWIKNNNQEDLQIGVELVGRNVKPVLCEKHIQGDNIAQPKLEALTCSLGSHGFDTPLVLLPKNRFRLGDILNLHATPDSETTSLFKLTENLPYEGQFDCFRLKATTIEARTQQEVVT